MDEVQIVNGLIAAGPAAIYLIGLRILWTQIQADRAACTARERELHAELLKVVDRYHESNQELATTLSIIAERLDNDDRTDKP